MRHDVLSDALSALKTQADKGQSEIVIRPVSNLIKAVFEILKKEGYIESYEVIEDGRGRYAKVKVTNQVNKIGSIRPRFAVSLQEFEKFEKRYLPAKDFGRLILSTSKGLMTHLEAKASGQGGVLLAYVY